MPSQKSTISHYYKDSTRIAHHVIAGFEEIVARIQGYPRVPEHIRGEHEAQTANFWRRLWGDESDIDN